MLTPQCLGFGPFRLDLGDERLWKGQEVIPLSPKSLAVLGALAMQAGHLVTKDTLLTLGWPETAGSEAVLAVAIRQLRCVLRDQARTPRFIETVHGRGYRFIAPVRLLASATASLPFTSRTDTPLISVNRPQYFGGRDAELAQLGQWWQTARQGTRQVGMLVGEAGIGKTALAHAFVAQVSAAEDVWIGHGQCIDHYGDGEPYLPILEALGRLGRSHAGSVLIPILQQYAPSCLVHLPALLPSVDRLTPTPGAGSSARMLREIAEMLEILTTAQPLILVLEDLHWSDHATLKWLTYMVRRNDPARLLILGTFRPVDLTVSISPRRLFFAELRQQSQYAELQLAGLSDTAVAAYLQQRFAPATLPTCLSQCVRQRSSGHPLFLVTLADALAQQLGWRDDTAVRQDLVELGILQTLVPLRIRQYIEQQLEQLSSEEQELLEVASVAGSTFAIAAVAAAVVQAPESLEAHYTTWARQGRFVRAGSIATWPDGTVTACYQFLHVLYHEVVYARVLPGQRLRWHQQIRVRLETGYGTPIRRQTATEIAL